MIVSFVQPKIRIHFLSTAGRFSSSVEQQQDSFSSGCLTSPYLFIPFKHHGGRVSPLMRVKGPVTERCCLHLPRRGNASSAACAVIAPWHNAPTVVPLINYSGPASEGATFEHQMRRPALACFKGVQCTSASTSEGAVPKKWGRRKQNALASRRLGEKRRRWPLGKRAAFFLSGGVATFIAQMCYMTITMRTTLLPAPR